MFVLFLRLLVLLNKRGDLRRRHKRRVFWCNSIPAVRQVFFACKKSPKMYNDSVNGRGAIGKNHNLVYHCFRYFWRSYKRWVMEWSVSSQIKRTRHLVRSVNCNNNNAWIYDNNNDNNNVRPLSKTVSSATYLIIAYPYVMIFLFTFLQCISIMMTSKTPIIVLVDENSKNLTSSHEKNISNRIWNHSIMTCVQKLIPLVLRGDILSKIRWREKLLYLHFVIG